MENWRKTYVKDYKPATQTFEERANKIGDSTSKLSWEDWKKKYINVNSSGYSSTTPTYTQEGINKYIQAIENPVQQVESVYDLTQRIQAKYNLSNTAQFKQYTDELQKALIQRQNQQAVYDEYKALVDDGIKKGIIVVEQEQQATAKPTAQEIIDFEESIKKDALIYGWDMNELLQLAKQANYDQSKFIQLGEAAGYDMVNDNAFQYFAESLVQGIGHGIEDIWNTVNTSGVATYGYDWLAQAQEQMNNAPDFLKGYGQPLYDATDEYLSDVRTYKIGVAEQQLNESAQRQADERETLNVRYGDVSDTGKWVGENIAYTGGRMASAIAAASVNPLAGGALLFAQAKGGGMKQAVAAGADLATAEMYGNAVGLTEVLIEAVSGGMVGLSPMKGLSGKLVEKVSNTAVAKTVSKFVNTTAGKWVVMTVSGAVGEGLEEVASEALTPALMQATFDPNAQLPTMGELMETFASSAALATVIGGPTNVSKAKAEIQIASDIKLSAAVRAATDNVEQDYKLQEQNKGQQGNVLSFALAQEQKMQRIAAAQAVADADNGQVNRQVQAQGQRSAGNALLYDNTNAAAQNTRANNPLQAALDAEAEKAWYGNAGRNMQGENAADSSAVLKALPVPQSMQDNAGNIPSVGQVGNTVQQDGTEINSQKNMLKKIPGEDASVNVPVVELVMEKILSRKNSDGTITNDLAEENAKTASRITVDKNSKTATKKFGSVEQLQQRVALTGDKNGTMQLFTLSELIQRGTVTEQHARDITKQLSMTEIKLDGETYYVPSYQADGLTGAFTDRNNSGIISNTTGGDRGKNDNAITYNSAKEIPKKERQGKPKNSPDINKWYNGNGKISIDNSGIWTYHGWEGHSVSYPNGYPEFKSAGMVIQEVDIGSFVDRTSDYKKADLLAPNGPRDAANNTWHHHEDGKTLQEIDSILHKRFTHRGGISLKKYVEVNK